MSRNAAFDALFVLGAAATWGGGKRFAESGRRLKTWDKAQQPALFQVEPEEIIQSVDGQLHKRMLHANWIVYHNVGRDQGAVPGAETNDILDALEAALRPPMANARQTLGGLAYRVFVSGNVLKITGDLDGQAMIVVPITLILP